ncbi:uroporphyrinogen-III synthase [Meridianimarinicoccus sp. RP-17]|uniref:uroporphyrinogen-III synthase n=1 Tax=Meridianimarinicoccus zhengii TaxID=2056810 RepID=UPI000DAB59C2|nr:uroporphyrinogen-III synthase [Phycocomes zhengii]
MPSTPTVLLTRPADASRRFAQALHDRLGAALPVLIAPLLDIVPDPRAAAAALAGAGGVILSSENGAAVCAAAGIGAGLPAFCVGVRTAETARAAGFLPVDEPPGDLDGLIAQIVACGWSADRGPLVHLHGAHVTGDAAAALVAAGIPARAAVVYDQQARPLSDAARQLLAGYDPVIVPVFSPRSARLIAPALVAARAPLRVAAISPRAADAVGVHGASRVQTARSPDAAAMIETIAALLSGWESS